MKFCLISLHQIKINTDLDTLKLMLSKNQVKCSTK